MKEPKGQLDPDACRIFNFTVLVVMLHGAVLWINGRYVAAVVPMLGLIILHRGLQAWCDYMKGR